MFALNKSSHNTPNANVRIRCERSENESRKKTASFSSYSISVPPAIMVQTQETTSYYFLISLLISFDSFVNFLAKLSLYAAISTIL